MSAEHRSNLQPFTGNGDVDLHMGEKFSSGKKNPQTNKQTNKQINNDRKAIYRLVASPSPKISDVPSLLFKQILYLIRQIYLHMAEL